MIMCTHSFNSDVCRHTHNIIVNIYAVRCLWRRIPRYLKDSTSPRVIPSRYRMQSLIFILHFFEIIMYLHLLGFICNCDNCSSDHFCSSLISNCTIWIYSSDFDIPRARYNKTSSALLYYMTVVRKVNDNCDSLQEVRVLAFICMYLCQISQFNIFTVSEK